MTTRTPLGNNLAGNLQYDGVYMYGKQTGVYMAGPTYGLTSVSSFNDCWNSCGF